MLTQYLRHCVSVRLSDTSRRSAKMAKPRTIQTMPRNSPNALSFLTPTAVGGQRPIKIFAQSDPPFFRT